MDGEFVLELVLPGGVCKSFNFPRNLTVGEVKTRVFESCEELDSSQINTYVLGVSPWSLLSSSAAPFVTSHATVAKALDQSHSVKLSLFASSRNNSPIGGIPRVLTPTTQANARTRSPAGAGGTQSPQGRPYSHSTNEQSPSKGRSAVLPPPPTVFPPAPSGSNQIVPTSLPPAVQAPEGMNNLVEVVLPNGSSVFIPVDSEDDAETYIRATLQDVFAFMGSLPKSSDLLLKLSSESEEEDEDFPEVSNGVTRYEASTTRTAKVIDRSEFQLLQRQNAALREEIARLQSDLDQSLTAAATGGTSGGTRMESSPERDSGQAEENPEERSRVPVQIIFPGDYAMMLPVSSNVPLWIVKAWAWRLGSERQLLDGPLEYFSLKEDGAESPLFDEDVQIKGLNWPADEDNIVRGSLHIVQKPDINPKDGRSQEEKKLAVHIGHTIGRPLAWASADDEVSRFRHSSSRIVAQELDNGCLNTGMYNINANVMSLPHPPYVPDKFQVRFRLVETMKTILGFPNESPDWHLERGLKKFRGFGVSDDANVEDYILKITGRTEYMEGSETPLACYQSIRSSLKMKERIELEIIPRSSLEVSTEDPRIVDKNFFQDWHDERRSYNHELIAMKQRAWDEMLVISIRDLKRPLRLRVIGVDGLNFETFQFRGLLGEKIKKNEKCADFVSDLYVVAGVVHGGDLMAPEMTSRKIPGSSSPRWYQWLESEINLSHIPRTTRVCLTVFATVVKSGKQTIEFPVGWVNLQLIDYQRHLQSGVFTYRLWPEGAANPIGTCQDNGRTTKPATLTVEFDSYALPVVFPEDDHAIESEGVGVQEPTNSDDMAELKRIINTDPLYKLTMNDKELLLTYRHFIKKTPRALAKFLSAIAWNEPNQVRLAHTLLGQWASLTPVEALELLDARYADQKVREYAVMMLDTLSDDELLDYLLQLVQTLKYEPYHDSALSRFLLQRSLRNRIRLGHAFFWLLKSETHVPEIAERYALLLESYLRGCGEHRQHIETQTTMLKEFVGSAEYVKKFPLAERKPEIQKKLQTIKFPPSLQLPLNPSMEVTGLRIEKCKSMDSKKVPLWLVFENNDPKGSDIFVMFKAGDDLRQDMLTLQLIRIMDKVWQAEGLDLYMSPYGCVATGDEEGMLELVLNSDTTANITKKAGGATAAFSETPLADWLKSQNPNIDDYNTAVNLFTMSCAGYCVATYVLGIGDRHNDNIMLKKNGQLFHIDFGHFLGNLKRWKGIKRERAPFVFTPDFAYVMGGKGAAKYQEFVELCCKAYNILRRHAHMFFNLFAMMLSTGIPELTSPEDLNYLREAFSLDMTEEEASTKFTKLIEQSRATKATRLNNAIHIIAHS